MPTIRRGSNCSAAAARTASRSSCRQRATASRQDCGVNLSSKTPVRPGSTNGAPAEFPPPDSRPAESPPRPAARDRRRRGKHSSATAAPRPTTARGDSGHSGSARAAARPAASSPPRPRRSPISRRSTGPIAAAAGRRETDRSDRARARSGARLAGPRCRRISRRYHSDSVNSSRQLAALQIARSASKRQGARLLAKRMLGPATNGAPTRAQMAATSRSSQHQNQGISPRRSRPPIVSHGGPYCRSAFCRAYWPLPGPRPSAPRPRESNEWWSWCRFKTRGDERREGFADDRGRGRRAGRFAAGSSPPAPRPAGGSPRSPCRRGASRRRSSSRCKRARSPAYRGRPPRRRGPTSRRARAWSSPLLRAG